MAKDPEIVKHNAMLKKHGVPPDMDDELNPRPGNGQSDNTPPNADPDKSPGELTEGRTDPTLIAPAGDYPVVQQSGYSRETAPAESDDITYGDEAQKRRDKMQRQEKAEGDR